MSNAKKSSSLFDDDEEDDEGLSSLRAKRAAAKTAADNPLSFFSFGSGAAAPSTAAKPPPAATKPAIFDEDEDTDDEFFKSPPGSLKKAVKKTTSSAFDLSEEDEIEMPREALSNSLLSGLSFKAATGPANDRPASADPIKGAGQQSDSARIAALEEQLAKANRTIKKLQDKAKSVCSEMITYRVH